MFSPSDYRHLYIYPSTHVHYQQSQVDINTLDTTRFPSLQYVSALEVNLEPGDMLYIPPYWFHHVECHPKQNQQPICISVSTISPSEEESLCGHLLDIGPKYIDGYDLKERIMIAQHLIKLLINSLDISSSLHYIHRILWNRYKLMEDIPMDNNIISLLEQTKCFFDERKVGIKQQKELEDEVEINIYPILSKLEKINIDIRDICIGNYIESLGSVAVGANHVPAFLNYCFIEK